MKGAHAFQCPAMRPRHVVEFVGGFGQRHVQAVFAEAAALEKKLKRQRGLTGSWLAFDEVQTGMGRTGYWYAYQAEGVAPDVVALAKGLGGGLPLGACIAFGAAARLLEPGMHASTFGGNPVCCAAALAVLDTIEADGLLAPERKRALPRFPNVVGVVTSAEGAALHDIINVVRKRAPWVKLVVSPARVQGEGAAIDIAQAIRRLERSDADVVIVGRGGGSSEDLWAFNEEIVARAGLR